MADRLPVPYSERKLPVGQRDVRQDEASLRSLICHIGRLMHEAHYVSGPSGSISARLDAHHVLITPPMLSKRFLQPEQLLALSLEPGRSGPAEALSRASSLAGEWSMHHACYQQRPDVGGVILAHPPSAVALTVGGVSMRTCVVPEAVVVLGLVPTAAFNPPENQEAVRVLVAQHDALLLAHYGSLTVGPDVLQAFEKLEILEHTATILHRAAQLGPIAPLTPPQVARLLELRRQLGYWREGDEERFCEMCGVC